MRVWYSSRELKKRFGLDFVGLFYEGLAVAVKDEKWFHVRHNYTPAYEKRFDFVGRFSNGLARVMNGVKWFHIRHDGSAAYEERFDYVDRFYAGTASVTKGRKNFSIYPDGTFQFDALVSLPEEVIRAIIDWSDT